MYTRILLIFYYVSTPYYNNNSAEIDQTVFVFDWIILLRRGKEWEDLQIIKVFSIEIHEVV